MKEGIALQESGVRTASISDYLELTKPRITLLVVLTGAVGYFMASRTGMSLAGLLHILVGTGMVAASAGVLNQVMEKDADARMIRTSDRPIPAGRVSPESALLFGTLLGLGGVFYIAILLNLTTGLLAAVTLGSYVFIYTPLKRVTTLNTLVGAIPGALPPVGGWAAATDAVSREAWILFLVVFLWQIPHFLAIAWLLKDDYARAGFRMLTVNDPGGRVTGRHIAISAMALIPVSLSPTLLGMTGPLYFTGAALLSLVYAGVSLWMAISPSSSRARILFLTSIVYLPALLAIMMIDRLPA